MLPVTHTVPDGADPSLAASPGAGPSSARTVAALHAQKSRLNPLTEPVAGVVLAVVCVVVTVGLVIAGWFVVLPLPLVGIGLGLATAMGNGVMKTPFQRAVPESTEVLWRCPISTVGNTAGATGESESKTGQRAPQDVMVITTSGIHFLNATSSKSAGSEAWPGLAGAATASAVRQALEGVTGLDDFADLAATKMDALVNEGGYISVISADSSNVVYPHGEIKRARVYERRYVSGYYFELELTDGTVDRRDILVAKAKRLELEELLSQRGYGAYGSGA